MEHVFVFADRNVTVSMCFSARLPFWEHNKIIKLRNNQFYIKYIGKSSSESCVGLFITLCAEWILKKHTKTRIFAHTY